MDLTIIISYYKALDNLKLILKGLNNQSYHHFEVIVSEDDYNPETISFLKHHSPSYDFPIIHLNQQSDIGFRKNSMLNKSIQKAKSKKLAFIDGDCIPHKHFVKQYVKNIEEQRILWGRRVMLDKKTSSNLLTNFSFSELNIIKLLLSKSQKLKDAIYSPYQALSLTNKGIKGCNWGILKQHLLDVNGFDEDYVQAGVGEDDDVEWRLKANGLTMKSMKNKAIVYHLYHPKTYSNEGVIQNNQLLNKNKNKNQVICLNGINKLG